MADPTSKFKFISPGVFIDEIDNSQLPVTPGQVGPMVIGKAQKGPAMVPVRINSFSEFVETFGHPLPGGDAEDVSRNGNTLAPSYGGYASEAWLRNSSPLTFMRVLGVQDPDASTDAGYAGYKAGTLDTDAGAGGAWGLFLWPSGALGQATGQAIEVTGALAAVFHCTTGRVLLDGSVAVTGSAHLSSSVCELYETNANGDIDLKITSDGTEANFEKVTVSLNPNKDNFIRKVLNTNPTVTNTSITRTATAAANQGGKFWLGETFERSLLAKSVSSVGVLSASSGNESVTETAAHAAILPLRNQEDVTQVGNDFLFAATKGSTGWYFCQHLVQGDASSTYDATLQQRLFRFESLTAGEAVQRDIKISLTDIKAPTGAYQKYGTFSVVVRKMSDNDNKPVILERWDQCDLNPASPNYLAKKIGDKYEEYDTTLLGNRTYGTHPNRSLFVRVVMDGDVDAGVADAQLLPAGVFGPLTYRTVRVLGSSGGLASATGSFPMSSSRGSIASMVDGGGVAFGAYASAASGALNKQHVLSTDNTAFTGSVIFPSVPLRKKSDWGKPKSLKNTYWGAWLGRSSTDVVLSPQVFDCLRVRAKGMQTVSYSPDHDLLDSPNQDRASADPLVLAWHFTLDDISGSAAEGYQFVSGSRQSSGANKSYTSAHSSFSGALNAGLDRFTTVLHGGFDGFDVTEKDPFRQSAFGTATDEKVSSPLHTLMRAVNIVSDSEAVQYNLATIPGVVQTTVTNHLLDTVENRADALAIIDIDKLYDADTENTNSIAERNAYTIKQATDALSDRNINNSYGAAYAPWVLAHDKNSNRSIWMPPSVAALGVLASTDKNDAPWFAPAGFTRGGLSEGAAGLPILDVSKRLTQDDRDSLYENGINPIAKFPAEGIVVFGQKTLQQTRSALDRINVRRLMIYIKRRISFIASRLLFDPNSQVTWDRFKGQATAILDDVKAQFGIEEFRLVLDETTTTPDLIDQNVIYAKLLVKPTRAVEFFAIDFVVTNSGAGFED